MNIMYTADGNKVQVIEHINNTTCVVRNIHVEGDHEFPSGEKYVVSTATLREYPAETWLERKNKELNAQKEHLENTLSNLQKDIKSSKESINKYGLLHHRNLKACEYMQENPQFHSDFSKILSGNFKYAILFNKAQRLINVKALDNLFFNSHFNEISMNCLSICMNKDGTLTFKIGQYRDESGHFSEFQPYDDVDSLLDGIEKILLEFESTWHYDNIDHLIIGLKKLNIKVPAFITQMYKDKLIAACTNEITTITEHKDKCINNLKLRINEAMKMSV